MTNSVPTFGREAVFRPRPPFLAAAFIAFLAITAAGQSASPNEAGDEVYTSLSLKAEGGDSQLMAAKAREIPEKSIAVLPFDSFSDEKANAFFADGIQQDVITNLAQTKEFKITDRSSMMRYRGDAARNLREIATQLGVAFVIEGSVRRAGDRVRISVELIDAARDRHLWAETCDRQLNDVLALQSEIASKIAAAVRLTLKSDSVESKGGVLREAPSGLAARRFSVGAVPP